MSTDKSRFGKLIERQDGADFPFYNLLPVEVATWKWIVIILSCILGFAAISLIYFENQLLNLIPRVLFTAIPFVTFAVLVRPNWRAIFRPLKWADVPTIIVFWLLTLVLSALAAFIVSGGNPSSFSANSAKV